MELLKGFFTVPCDVTDERVIEVRKEYIQRYVEGFEQEGWRLVSDVALYKSRTPLVEDITEGRTRWLILAYWEREPVVQKFEVDEKCIPGLLVTGKFKEA